MKGISLPINVLVIVAIAIVVLLGLVAMYFTGFGPFTTAVGLEGVKNSACRVLVQEKRCAVHPSIIEIDGFDADKDGSNDPAAGGAANCNDPADGTTHDNLWSLCVCYYGIDQSVSGTVECKQLCACPGY